MGCGVGWADHHSDLGYQVPHLEFSYADLEGDYGWGFSEE